MGRREVSRYGLAMTAPGFVPARAGRQRLAPDRAMPRHRHAGAYAAIVLRGSYVEAGDEGRRRVGPGDVLVHRPFEAHLDRIARRGAEILNVPLVQADGLPPSLRARDPVALARAAEAAPRLAAAMLVEVCSAGPPALSDWPDLLADALRTHPDLRLAAWASAMGLAPATVSRGFRIAYGTTPRRYRAELRARRAWAALATGEPLSSIAFTCGFADQAHMTRAVRDLTGAPPSAWRAPTSSAFKTGSRARP